MNEKLEYLNPGEISFSRNSAGLITASFKGENIGRVAVLRMFPFECGEEYLSVRKENYERRDKEYEVGIIRSLEAFSEAQKEIVRDELKKRYFMPDILEVDEVNEEFGNTMWKVRTDAGNREFTVTDMSSNVINLGKNRIMLIDVYGNRYQIPDVTKADDKTVKILEIWI